MYAIRATLAALVLCAGTPEVIAAQAPVTADIRGRVLDDATGRPIGGALAQLVVGSSSRTTRTDETGEFRFSGVGLGPLTMRVRILGFEPFDQQVTIAAGMPPVVVRMRRIAMLDTVRVRAAKQGLFGVVAAATDLRPLPNAQLKIIGVSGGFIPLDSGGRFFVPVHTVGSYFLRAKAPGFDPQTIAVVVTPNNSVEVAFLLDSTGMRGNHQEEFAFGLFDDRIKRRGLMSALVTRSELFERGHKELEFALLFAKSFANRGLVLGKFVCIFVNGVPRPGVPLGTFVPEDIQAIEVYGASARSGDVSKTLEERWPRYAPCSDMGRPNSGGRDQLVKWVSIWTKGP